ncbi:MAG: T9SS type A sorting domain-containing protein [Ignavibacteriaceae bacterium]|nr:T9SS type A sorting domain-containing protein [Ignavibacteriaceae bacterium]
MYPSPVTQTEVFAVVHPLNPEIIFVSSNAISFSPSFFVSEGIYVSTDRGLNWRGSDTCNGANIQFHNGDPGIAIDKDGRFVIVRNGRTPFFGLFSHYSDDLGLNWSAQKNITNIQLERATLHSNTFSGTPGFGRTYAAWVRFTPPYPVVFSYTDDGGENWSVVTQINSPTQRNSGSEIAIGKDGTVYIVWAVVTPQSPFTEVFGGIARSTDGGQAWWVNENAFPMNGIQGVLSNKQNIRVNGLPRIAIDNSNGEFSGRIYVVTTERGLTPAGNDPDIILRYSDNGGVSWSNAIRVNKDQLNNGKTQYFPALNVDDFGTLNILYYDDRNTTNDSTAVFLSRSTDGGASFTEYEITKENFKPLPIGGLGQGYQGDNIALVSTGNKLFPFWMSNKTGIYQIWTADITVPVSVKEGIIPEEISFEISQNYPNPVSLSTDATSIIDYKLNKSGAVNLSLYSANGELIKVLINDYKSSGQYAELINLKELKVASGVYFVRMLFDGTVKTVAISVVN